MSKLFKFLGQPEAVYNKRFGIEVEAEGRNLLTHIPRTKIWTVVHDGSLRNGVEYLFAAPEDLKGSIEALKELRNALQDNGSDLDFSFRTSIHVHMNCLDLQAYQIFNLVYTLLLFEPILMRLSGEERTHNRFCLTSSDADAQINTLAKLFHSKRLFEGFPREIAMLNENEGKYSAINVVPLRSKGTVEVRTMRGNLNITLLSYYLTLLNCIYDWAVEQKSVEHIFKLVTTGAGFEDMLQDIVQGEIPLGFINYPEMREDVAMQASINIGLVYEV